MEIDGVVHQLEERARGPAADAPGVVGSLEALPELILHLQPVFYVFDAAL